MVHAHGIAMASVVTLLASLQPVRDRFNGPYFTVLVLTWQRTEFVEQAVRSVLAQSIPRSQYEIIVVRGYSNPVLDAQLTAMGAKIISTPTAFQGASLALGVAAARGEVIAFLDDDDEFEPTKLERLRADFEARPDLVLVRNDNRCIDVRGNPLPTWPGCAWPAAGEPRAIEQRTAEEKRRGPTLPIHNMSSISVRRESIAPMVPQWTEISSAADALVYLSALRAEGTARSDPAILTRRRIHASRSMENFSSNGIGPPESLARLRRLRLAHAKQLDMVRGTPAEPTARWLELIHRFEAAMTSTELPGPTVRDYIDMARGILRERPVVRAPGDYVDMLFLFAVARRFAPQRSIDAWWRFQRRRQSRLTPRAEYGSLFSRAGSGPSKTSPHSPH